MSATIRSALPDCSKGMRLAGFVATSSSLTPRDFASAFAKSTSYPTMSCVFASMEPNGGFASKVATFTTPAALISAS
ncbi:hypothetical protein D3C87_1614060 [compost metagenome]